MTGPGDDEEEPAVYGGLETSFERFELPLETPFQIARGSMDHAEVVVVRIGDGEHVGVGAASPSSYYGEDADSVVAALSALFDAVEGVPDPLGARRMEGKIRTAAPDDAAARAAVSIAIHDRAAKHLDAPLFELWGLRPDDAPRTSFTIGIAEPAAMAERAAAAVDNGLDVLKVKLGTDDDRGRLRAVREAAPTATIRVDGNCAWDQETALDRVALLESHDVSFLEQPVPADEIEALGAVTEATSIPVAADESCVDVDDVDGVADRCDAVVCKLMKCGGPWAAREQIAAAHDRGLEVMLGCMIESNASIAAAWQLAPMVERVDLDGSLLLASDPYDGVPLDANVPALDRVDRPGTGARQQRDE